MTETIKTKKIHSGKSINKKDLWEQFNTEIKEEKPLECVYRSSGERENCDICSSNLAITDEGFLACCNINCGIIYKDSLDQTAEWRFYGADSNQSDDPTRCGMPINPLLKESSFGCKVVCKAPLAMK